MSPANVASVVENPSVVLKPAAVPSTNAMRRLFVVAPSAPVRNRRVKVTGVAPTVTVGKYPMATREFVSIVQSIPVDDATSWDTLVLTHCVLVAVAALTVGEEEVVDEPLVPPMRSLSVKVSLTK